MNCQTLDSYVGVVCMGLSILSHGILGMWHKFDQQLY